MIRLFVPLILCALLSGCTAKIDPEKRLHAIAIELRDHVLADSLDSDVGINNIKSLPIDLVAKLNGMKPSLIVGFAHQVAPRDYFKEREEIDYTLLFSSHPHWIGIRMTFDTRTQEFSIVDFKDIQR